MIDLNFVFNTVQQSGRIKLSQGNALTRLV